MTRSCQIQNTDAFYILHLIYCYSKTFYRLILQLCSFWHGQDKKVKLILTKSGLVDNNLQVAS